MTSRKLKWLGIGLLILIGVLHLFLAPSEYEEMPLLGYLFVANFVAALAAAVGIRRGATWGWVLGFWVAAGALAGYVVTRTVGLPGMEVEEWLYPVGLLAMLLEGAFVALFAAAQPWRSVGPAKRWDPRLVMGAALGFVLAFGLAGFGWGALAPAGGGHEPAHEALENAKPISVQAFAEQYGVEVLQVAPSMMDSIVDIRLRVVDKAKAEALLSNHEMMPVIIVDGGKTVLTPPNQHMHRVS